MSHNIVINLGMRSFYNQLLVSGILKFSAEHGMLRVWFSDPLVGSGGVPKHIDGIIGMMFSESFGVDMKRTPIINVTSGESGNTLQVCCDNEAIVQLAVGQFYEHNFRNVAYLHIKGHDNSRARKTAFMEACKARSCASYVITVDSADLMKKGPGQDLLSAIDTLPKPAGLLLSEDCWFDLIFKSCESLNIDVPEDLSILGMNNNSDYCLSCKPTLSSIDINTPKVGYLATKTLCDLIEGRDVPIVQKIPPKELVRRESTTSSVILSVGVSKVVDFMHAHLSEPIVMDDLVNVQHLGRRALEKAFQMEVGQSPMNYLRELRLKRVKFLLKTTDLNVSQISQQCGFKHSTYLCRLFRTCYGTTPLAYRS